jgi:hypothetical protein
MVVAAASWAHSATVSDLESARRSLSAARDAVSTASVEFRTLLVDGGLTRTGIEDYRSYLARLKQSVVSNCRTILELKHDLGDSGPEPGCDPGRMAPAGPVSFPQERTEVEKTASLDGQLGASLSEFDELLLREMEDLKRQQSGSPDTAAGSGGGDGEGQSESQGEGSSTASGGAESGDSGQSGKGAQQQEAEQQQGGEVAARSEQNSQQQGAGNAGSREGKGDSTRTGGRDQPPAADDDDIVARQLREAAENETDPELREKLWQEYRRYKANQTTQSKN